ncbi:MarR family winged helix-turn-helix transcriptional regulator [Litoreibacter janthinus]|uniref:Transcriptional regulator, MarR family n=1 Tax=Litoreibacter janthinus TaxID=670154 RepID=A0A1I6GSW7_9RHOB|nr:MarR family transcriptional regulator [Litoreibacter janthinus]SFR45335.1 transcriptional regulator, MarR family [Litoreibacter janthinus]
MTDELDLYALPGHLIRRLHQQSTAVFLEHTKAAGFDLTSVQFAAMSTLAKDPGLDQASLAKRIAYDRATIGGVIKRLEQKGLVRRQPDDEDRRAFKVSLTPEGDAVLAKLAPVVCALQSRILPDLSESEKASLLALMTKALRPAS